MRHRSSTGRAADRRTIGFATVRDYALAIVRERYANFGPTRAAEKLANEHGLTVSRETLRNWMAGAGLWLSRQQRRTFHQSRLRREASSCQSCTGSAEGKSVQA